MPDIDPTDELDYRPRNPWPARVLAVVVVFSTACCVCGGLFLREPPTEPNRILVAVQIEPAEGEPATWWDPESFKDQAPARLHDAIVQGFDAVNLEVVSRETPRALEALAAADSPKAQRTTAANLGAAWLISGAVRATSATPIADTDWREYTFEARLRLVPTTGSAEAVDLPSPVRFRARGRSESEAAGGIAVDIAKLVTPPVLDALAEQPRIQHFAEPEGLSMEDQIVADQLRRFFRYLTDRREALAAHAEREEAGADIDRSRGMDPERRIGPWLGWEVYLGPAEAGKVLLKVDELRAELPISERTVELVEVHETIVLANEDGTERELLYDTYNFYGTPRVSADGRWVSGVLDERGRALTLLLIDVPNRAVTRLRSHSDHEYSSPIVSPDGQRVAYWWQSCRGCELDLRVLPVAGGEPTTVLHNVSGTGGLPTWSPTSDRLVLSITPPGRPASVWSVHAESGERTLLAGPGDGQRGDSFTRGILSPDGRFVAAAERERSGKEHLSILWLETGKKDRIFHGEVDRMDISPDSTMVAFGYQPEGSWDWEVGVLQATSGAMERVTRSPRTDHLGGWSRDSHTVYSMQTEREETQFYRVYANPITLR